MNPSVILGIETSCDETSIAIVENGKNVLVNVIASSVSDFEETAGVIPEAAARRQLEFMIPVLEKALRDSGLQPNQLDAIAVTRGPGLLGSLLVGNIAARTISSVWQKPLIGVHHTLGHLSSTWLEVEDKPQFPILTLSVSGGHSDVWLRTSHTHGTLLGRTRDDAIGEAFDKGASLLGLPYPGGPALAQLAMTGNRSAFPFPLPLRGEDTLDFSFSGLKTALRYLIRDLGDDEWPKHLIDLAASFEEGLCAHVLDRLGRLLDQHSEIKEVHIVGGVSANQRLRNLTQKLCEKHHCTHRVPTDRIFCTDNAAMIAAAGFFLSQEFGEAAYAPFTTQAQLSLSELLHV